MVDDTDGFGREGVPLVLLRQLWVNFGIFGEEGRRYGDRPSSVSYVSVGRGCFC